ncbi:MAG TPA: hypothetical protein VN408_23445 [Actinoplanes sp.]|nr:hypothetical protein [Actinoplanes sp.]
MSVTRKTITGIVKVGAIAALGAGAALGLGMGAASAAGTGNTVNNCYGIYWNTDWDQTCGAGGAGATGMYSSTGDCTSSADRYVDRYRNKGTGGAVDGGDCRFQVANVRTVFS